MRILFLNFIPIISYIGGVQRVTDNLAKELTKRGHKVYFAYYEERNIPKDYVFSCPQYYIRVNKLNLSSSLEVWRSLLVDNHIECIINQEGDEVSSYLLANTPFVIKKITVNHGQPFHGLEYLRLIFMFSKPKSLRENIIKYIGIFCPFIIKKRYINIFKSSLNQLLSVSDKYCVLSDRYIERIKKYYPCIDTNKFCVIPNPVIIDSSNNYSLKENIVLYVGRLANNPKNINSFLDMWKILADHNSGWKAVIVGDGPDREELIRYCLKNKINRVSFEGYKDDVSSYYKKAQFICLTSIHESWSMSLVEGMSYGCIPFVYKTYEATETIIDDKINGFLIKPFSPQEMAMHIQYMIDHPDERLSVGMKARDKSRQFSLDKVTDMWEKLLNSM